MYKYYIVETKNGYVLSIPNLFSGIPNIEYTHDVYNARVFKVDTLESKMDTLDYFYRKLNDDSLVQLYPVNIKPSMTSRGKLVFKSFKGDFVPEQSQCQIV